MGLIETILPLAAFIYSPSAVQRSRSLPVPVPEGEEGPRLFIRSPRQRCCSWSIGSHVGICRAVSMVPAAPPSLFQRALVLTQNGKHQPICPEAGAVYSGHLRPVQEGYGGWELTATVT